MLFIAAVIVRMLVIADANDLQHKELPLDLPNLMKRQDVDSLFRQLCRKLGQATGHKLHHFYNYVVSFI